MTPPVFPAEPSGQPQVPFTVDIPVFVTVFLITVLITTAVTFILPESYCSTARIKLTPADSGTVLTEMEVIKSEPVLKRVVEKSDLNNKWGKKYNNAEPLKTSESLEILKKRLNLTLVQATGLIDITAFSEDPREAADTANAVAESYQAYTSEKKSSAAAEILDRAMPGREPCRPNKPLNIAFGVALGIFLGGIVGAIVWKLHSRQNDKGNFNSPVQ